MAYEISTEDMVIEHVDAAGQTGSDKRIYYIRIRGSGELFRVYSIDGWHVQSCPISQSMPLLAVTREVTRNKLIAFVMLKEMADG